MSEQFAASGDRRSHRELKGKAAELKGEARGRDGIARS